MFAMILGFKIVVFVRIQITGYSPSGNLINFGAASIFT